MFDREGVLVQNQFLFLWVMIRRSIVVNLKFETVDRPEGQVIVVEIFDGEVLARTMEISAEVGPSGKAIPILGFGDQKVAVEPSSPPTHLTAIK